MTFFTSYSRRDQDAVKSLVRGFEVARRRVWFDNDLSGGEIWWDTILGKIRESTVFVFALSDHALRSKACMEEFGYAKALGKPIVPVQVGKVEGQLGHALSTLHVVAYRPDDADTGFEVLAAVDNAALRTVALPDPLPEEPVIPYAYLRALAHQIETAELAHTNQIGVVEQLRKALRDETEETVRGEIVGMLHALLEKGWCSKTAEHEIRIVLQAYESTPEEKEASTVDPGPVRGGGGGAVSEPDGYELFALHVEELQRQQDARVWEAPTVRVDAGDAVPRGPSRAAPLFGGVSGPTTLSTGGTAGPPGPSTEPAFTPSPPPASFVPPSYPPPAYGPPPAPYPPPPVPAPAPPLSPPNFRALSIVAFVFSFLFGGIAMYFSYQVGQRHRAGDLDGAVRASRNAKVWGIVGIVIGALVLVAYLGTVS